MSVIAWQQSGDRAANFDFNEPEFFRSVSRYKNLQIIQPAVLHGHFLQHGETGENRLLPIHLDRGRRRHEGLDCAGCEQLTRLRVVERDLLLPKMWRLNHDDSVT